MSDHEPEAGWNMPPGLHDCDIDRILGQDGGEADRDPWYDEEEEDGE